MNEDGPVMVENVIQIEGRRFVLVPEDEYRRFRRGPASPARVMLPPLPPRAADGTRDAVDFTRAAIARGMIRDRVARGLSQRELARRAGVPHATLARIETGKYTPPADAIRKLDAAIHGARRRPRAHHCGQTPTCRP